MVKSRTNVSIEGELLKEAQEKGLNMSQVLSHALRSKLWNKEQQESGTIICCKCGEKADQGYYWKSRKIVICLDCVKKLDYHKQIFDKDGQAEMKAVRT